MIGIFVEHARAMRVASGYRNQSKPNFSKPKLFGALSVAALLASTALDAYWSQSRAAPDPCVLNGAVLTCTGDQSNGAYQIADSSNTVDTLNVRNLTGPINPQSTFFGAGLDRIGDGDITINVDTGPYSISTSGDGAFGIIGRIFGNGTVSVHSRAEIFAIDQLTPYNVGIFTQIIAQPDDSSPRNGNISVDHVGNITAKTNAIFSLTLIWGNSA